MTDFNDFIYKEDFMDRPAPKRNATIYINNFHDWLELCQTHNQDPECGDILVGLDGGDYICYEYVGEYPIRR